MISDAFFLCLDADHQAETGYAEHALRAGQFPLDIRRAFFYARKHILVQTVQDVDRARAADRVSAEGRAVCSGSEYILHLFPQQRRAERQAAGKALGRGNDIRLDAIVHVSVQLSAAAIADLYFIADEKQIIFLAQLCRALDIRLVQRHDTALALHNLHHDGGTFVGLDQLLEIGQIVGLSIDEALCQRGVKSWWNTS